MSKDVLIVTGAGQLSLAITRRIGYGKKIILGDKSLGNAKKIGQVLLEAGYDVEAVEMELSSRASIQAMLVLGQGFGPIKYLVNGAGVIVTMTVLKIS